MIKLIFPTNILKFTNNSRELTFTEGTLINIFDQFYKIYPEAYKKIFQNSHQLRPFVNFTLDGELINAIELPGFLGVTLTGEHELKLIILFSGG